MSAILGFIGLLLGALQAPDLAGLDARAMDAYRAGEYEEAGRAWRAALHHVAPGPTRGRLLYDIGNTAYREDRPVEATAWYTAALDHVPRSKELWNNLEQARRAGGLEEADRGDLSSAFWRLSLVLTRRESARLAFFATLVLGAVLLVEALRRGRFWGGLSLVAIVLALACWLPYLRHAVRPSGFDGFVVAPGGAVLRSEPREELERTGTLKPVTRVREIDSLLDWVRIETTDGERGWTSRASILDTAGSADAS